MANDPFTAIAMIASATQTALMCLNKCLVANGQLKPGQFATSLKATFNHPDADWTRLDYSYLQNLAAPLDKEETPPE